MVEVQGVALPRSRGAYRDASIVVQPGRRSARRSLATRTWIRPGSLALSEARRTWNRGHTGLASGLRCECTRPGCRDRVPVVAERHRRVDQFVVAPAHVDGGVVARAADRFFIIEAAGRALRHSRREMT